MLTSRLSRIAAGDGSDLCARMTYTPDEQTGVRREKVRLAMRAEVGKDWDGKADNDNVSWPLAKALLAEGNGELLRHAVAYRSIYEKAKTEVIIGINGAPAPELKIVHRSSVDESTGNITYGGEVRSRASSVSAPATMSTPTNPDSKKKAQPVPRPWTGDRAINDAIDARTMLARLQAAVGSTIEPFEMAVVDGATLQEVGNAAGIANRGGAMAAGRAIVHMGLVAIRDVLGGKRAA